MEKDQLSRKLAVILHADVVGSTALVQKNETLAHVRQTEKCIRRNQKSGVSKVYEKCYNSRNGFS